MSKATISRILIILFAIISIPQFVSAQSMKWYNPQQNSFNPIEGQFWQDEERSNFYNRLPDNYRNRVRTPVWNLSTNSAGLSIRFRTNSPMIAVRYNLVDSLYTLHHMPDTGVNGVDLYRYVGEDEMVRIPGRFNFGQGGGAYGYTSLNNCDGVDGDGYVYHLYLPLYNGVKEMEIGAVDGFDFEFVTPRTENPIVVYGTSIAQGACASRPAMAWTNIVSRELNMPLYNFGFSGNGKLETPLLEMICEIDASIYVLDCMPNLSNLGVDKIAGLVLDAVKLVRSKRPDTPIILTDHLGYSEEAVVDGQRAAVERCRVAQKAVFDKLVELGVKELYYLSYEDLPITSEAFVDYVHPSDYGMTIYAKSYEALIRSILDK